MITDEFIDELVDAAGGWRWEPGLGSEVEWRYMVEPDDISAFEHINDAECWGDLWWEPYNRNTGQSQRPAHFDGNARIVERDAREALWWQPRPDIWGTPRPWNFDDDFALVQRLLEDGFCMARVERRQHETCGTCGHGHVETDDQYLGGIDVWPWDPGGADYHRTICSDMVHEIASNHEEKENA